MTAQWLRRIEATLWPDGFSRNVWMIVDAARDRRIFPMLREVHLEHYCLYSGPLPPALEAAAPYLAQLDHDDEDTRRFLTNAWDNHWGVLVKCVTHHNALRRHLRRFLLVRDPAGKRMLFRYYDPRVLRTYLPTCLEGELQNFFGPIECFWTECTPGHLLEFRLHRGKLVQRELSLEAGDSNRYPNSSSERNEESEALIKQRLLTMRMEQMAVFSEAEMQKFESWMTGHLTKFFPQQCGRFQPGQLRALIQYGIQRARAYGVTSQRDVCKFIDVMLIFGRDFDTDERCAWASGILRNRSSEGTKMRALVEAAVTELRRS